MLAKSQEVSGRLGLVDVGEMNAEDETQDERNNWLMGIYHVFMSYVSRHTNNVLVI